MDEPASNSPAILKHPSVGLWRSHGDRPGTVMRRSELPHLLDVALKPNRYNKIARNADLRSLDDPDLAIESNKVGGGVWKSNPPGLLITRKLLILLERT
jgi:hypothetical protein